MYYIKGLISLLVISRVGHFKYLQNTHLIHKGIVEVCVLLLNYQITSNCYDDVFDSVMQQQSIIEVQKSAILIQPKNVLKIVIYMI